MELGFRTRPLLVTALAEFFSELIFWALSAHWLFVLETAALFFIAVDASLAHSRHGRGEFLRRVDPA
jgi:hypothetical protein